MVIFNLCKLYICTRNSFYFLPQHHPLQFDIIKNLQFSRIRTTVHLATSEYTFNVFGEDNVHVEVTRNRNRPINAQVSFINLIKYLIQMSNEMESLVNNVVLPGDVVLNLKSDIKSKIIVGPGLRVSWNKIVVTKCGILYKKKPNTYWVDTHQKRYVPARGEAVVGVVTNKQGDYFKVDIGSSDQAQLSYLSFEGATKKIRPMLNVGDVVYSKLVTANRDLEPELVCVDSQRKKGKLGILSSDGFMFNCSLNLVRKILNPKCPLLDTFEKTLQMPFEIAAGMNGNIWIRAKTVQETIAVANVILAAEFKTDSEIKELCENIGNILAGF